jgi:hypothetical protein
MTSWIVFHFSHVCVFNTLRETNHFVIEVSGALAIADSIALLSQLLDPVSIVLELTNRNPTRQSLAYLIWG